MSFDIFLQRFQNNEVNESLCSRVQAIINSQTHQGPDEFNRYTITLSDEACIDMYAQWLDGSKPFNSCMFVLHEWSREVSKLIFDVARAGDMVIFPAVENSCPILYDGALQAHLPCEVRQTFDHIIICATAEELYIFLMSGYRGWKTYRDRVIDG